MSALSFALGTAVAASWAYWVVAAGAVRHLLHARPQVSSGGPGVSLLKPVRGVDAGAFENFASFCRQDYGTFEIVFGVADPRDPAVEVVERLRREFPDVPIRLVVAPLRGANRKATLLDALAREARHDVLVANDSDMRADPDYLARVVATLSKDGVGVVTCAYRGEDVGSITAGLEALHMGVTFLPSAVFAGEVMHMAFAMGATVALRRRDLDLIGGFAAVEEFLADDYQIGARVAAIGRGVAICPYVLRSVLGATRFRDQWQRELRWARCARVSRPAGHVGYALTFSTPLSLALLAALHGQAAGWAVLAGSMSLRWAVALALTRETGDAASRRWLALLPVRDLLTAAVWGAALVTRRVVWRGDFFRVERDGRVVALGTRR